MFANFVSDLLKAAAVDLLFKRPVTLQLSRDASGKFDFRANINPSSGGSQQPLVVMAQPQMYGYPGAYPPGYPAPYQPGYPMAFQQPSLPPAPGAPSQPQSQPAPFDPQIPDYLRR